jgi:hypothetical protein
MTKSDAVKGDADPVNMEIGICLIIPMASLNARVPLFESGPRLFARWRVFRLQAPHLAATSNKRTTRHL